MSLFTLTGLPDGKEITVTKTREPLFNQNRTIDYLAYQRFVTDTGEQYYYVPQEFVAKGLTQQTPDGKTFVVAKPSLLDKEILKKAIPVVIPKEGLGAGSGEFEGALGQYANLYEKPTTGFLFKGDEDVIKAFSTKPSFWNVGDSVQKEGGGTSAEFSGKIVGIGEKDGQYVYLQEPREGVSSSYLTSSGTHKTYTAPSRPGGLLGTLSDFIADTPFLPEIVSIIAAANPATAPFAGEIYAASKGIQTAARGGEVDDVLKSVAVAYAGAKVVPAVVKTALPAEVAAIPGAVPAVSATTTSLLTGQPIETALQAGLASGTGSVVGGQVSGATGSQAAGQVVGGTTAGLLSGKDAVTSAVNSLIGASAQQAGNLVNRALFSSRSSNMDDYYNELIRSDPADNEFFAADAAQLAAQGIPETQINEILQLSGASPIIASNMSKFASQGLDAASILRGANIYDYAPVGANLGAVGGTGGTAGQLASTATRSLLQRLLGTGGTAAGGAAGGNLANTLLNALLGTGTGSGGLLSRGIDYATAEKIADQLRREGATITEQAQQAAQAAQVPFTPYTVTTGLGTSTFGPTGATVTPTAPYSAIQQEALQQAQEALGAISPAQASQTLFGQLEGLQAPFRQRQQEELLSRLGARGLLGFGQNLPIVGGGMGTVNPYMESLLSAQASQQAQNALAAQQFGTQEAARQQALAQALTTQGMGIDQQTAALLTQTANIGAIPMNLALTNRGRQLEASLRGLGYQVPFSTAAANIQAGQTGLLGQTTKDVSSAILKEILG